MPITDIKEIRILPPLALARFGSSEEPMHNYDVEAPPDIVGFRQLVPAETLVIHPQEGTVLGVVTPSEVKFRDGAGRIKPVAPFLELWARFDDGGPLRPLTEADLADVGLGTDAVQWSVRVGNLKMFRRTGDPRDRITAQLTPTELAGHARRELRGTAVNFKANRTVTLGAAQFIRPSTDFPEIRLRFTPSKGLVFGHAVRGVITAERAVYNGSQGVWDTHSDDRGPSFPAPRARLSTVPGGIYAQDRPPVGQGLINLGLLDDSCDGIVSVAIDIGNRQLNAFARVSSGPPAFAPDSMPVRSVADDIEQILLGAEHADPTADEVIDLMRRAVETMRLMNSENENRQFPFWESSALESFGPNGARYWSTRELHQALLSNLEGLRAAPGSPERQTAVGVLRIVANILREPEKTSDYTVQAPAGQRPAMQRMPALMRGSDGGLLTLSRRQQSLIRKAVEVFGTDIIGGTSPRDAMLRMIGSHTFAATLHSAFALPGGGTIADLFSRPEDLLAYLQNPGSVARGAIAASLGLTGRRLVVPGNPAGSAFFQSISSTNHPMNGPLSAYQDPVLAISGLEVVQSWIATL